MRDTIRSNVSVARVRSEADIDAAVAKLAAAPGGGLIVPPDAYTVVHRGLIMQAAARTSRFPRSTPIGSSSRKAALMAYGPDTADIFRRAASYVDRILKGANPGDLPAQAPVKFELAINLNTARMLGLDVPPTLLALADEVIE